MKQLFYLAGLGLITSSCGGESANGNENSDTTKTDTLAVVPENIRIDETALMAKFSKSAALPFVQDSLYLETAVLNDSNALTADEAKWLSYGFVDTEVSYEGLAPVQDFLFFDSLKADGSYEGYIETAGIGMMVRSDAYVAQKVIVDDSTEVLLWIVDYSTFDACPYSTGKVLYGTVLRNGKVTSSTILGEDSGGADAPVWSNTRSLVSMSDDGFSVFKKDQNSAGETDENGQEIVDESTLNFILTIDENGVWTQQPAVVTGSPA